MTVRFRLMYIVFLVTYLVYLFLKYSYINTWYINQYKSLQQQQFQPWNIKQLENEKKLKETKKIVRELQHQLYSSTHVVQKKKISLTNQETIVYQEKSMMYVMVVLVLFIMTFYKKKQYQMEMKNIILNESLHKHHPITLLYDTKLRRVTIKNNR